MAPIFQETSTWPISRRASTHEARRPQPIRNARPVVLRVGLTLAAMLLGTVATADPPGRDVEHYREILALRHADCLDQSLGTTQLSYEQADAVVDYLLLDQERTNALRLGLDVPTFAPACDENPDGVHSSDCPSDEERSYIKGLVADLRVELHEVDDDAEPEIFVWGRCVSGERACMILGFEDQDFRPQPMFRMAGDCIMVGSATNRLRDIIAISRTSDDMVRFAITRFDGTAYRSIGHGTYGPYLSGD